MFGLRCAVFALGCIVIQPGLRAETIKIEGDTPRERITVTIQNQTIDNILKDLGKAYGLKIKGVANVRVGEPITTTLSGSLETILGRLLRNWNYVIVRSAHNKCGIEKVMILDSNYGTTPARTQRANTRKNFSDNLRRRLSAKPNN